MSDWIQQNQGEVADAEALCRFVALQPIVNRNRETFGYELLFRTSWENRFSSDGDVASQHMVDNVVAFGMDSLVGDKTPFLNCTRDILLRGIPTLLPKNTVLEVLESIAVDEQLVAACRTLRTMGYALALDDYDFSPQWNALLPYVSFIKVDFRVSTSQQRYDLIQRLRYLPIKFVAEKVETDEEYRLGLAEGFHFFQGYFFTRPVVLGRRALTSVINRLRFMAALSCSTFHRVEVLRFIKEEPSISYRLLRMANSAATALREPLRSLHAALNMIGEDEFRKMAMTALASELYGTQGSDTMRFILQKARFCELMATELGLEPTELYLFGMVSVVRSALKLSDADLHESIQLRPEIIAALSGEANIYSLLLTLTATIEEGHWTGLSDAAAALHVSEDVAFAAFTAARLWAENILNYI
jgi:EAL and modified HD-GYP domain-containing signal transduction protein